MGTVGGKRTAAQLQADAAFIAAAGSLDFAALAAALSAPTPGAGPANQFKQAICELDNMASLALEDGLLDRAAEYKAASEALSAAASASIAGSDRGGENPIEVVHEVLNDWLEENEASDFDQNDVAHLFGMLGTAGYSIVPNARAAAPAAGESQPLGGGGPYSGALRIPAGDNLLALSQQLRADAEQTRVRHSVRTAYCAVSIDDLVCYTVAVEQSLAASVAPPGAAAGVPLTIAECFEAMRLNRMQVAIGRLVEAVDYMLPKIPVRKLDADDEMSIRVARSTGQEIFDELKKVLDDASARVPAAPTQAPADHA
jgi:hypothetical protein